ncbi:MAG: permease prefix domain 1-containing protein [Planctomycetota bacterium]|jgi:hypothetical protein
MFELNEQIAKWRSSLNQSDRLSKSDIDELESHLREEIENLIASKLSEQEAFLVAAHRLGHSSALAEEFEKVNTHIVFRKRLFWAVAGLFSFVVAKHVGSFASNVGVLLASMVGVRGYGLGAVKVLVQGIFFCAVILALYQIVKTKCIRGGWFSKLADSLWGKVALFASVIMAIVAMFACRFFAQIATARLIGVSDFGQMAILVQSAGLVLIVILPLILLGIIIKLRPGKTPRIEV